MLTAIDSILLVIIITKATKSKGKRNRFCSSLLQMGTDMLLSGACSDGGGGGGAPGASINKGGAGGAGQNQGYMDS